MKKLLKKIGLKLKFIPEFIEKHYKFFNFITLSIALYFTYITVDWIALWEYIINLPENTINFANQTYIDVVEWLKKFLKKSSEDWIILVLIGVSKRYLVENLLIPRIIKHYVRYTFNPIFRYYSLKRRELRKFAFGIKMAFTSIFLGIPSFILVMFGWMKFVIALINKVLVNKVWSLVKFVILKGIPAVLTWSMNLPIVAELVEYIIISWFLKPLLKIPGAERLYLYISKSIVNIWISFKKFLINFRIDFIANFYNKIMSKVLYFFRKVTVSFAIVTRRYFKNKVVKILNDKSHDYKSGDHNYDYLFFHKILKKVKAIKLAKKKRIKKEKKEKRKKQIQKLKKAPAELKNKVAEFMSRKKGEKMED